MKRFLSVLLTIVLMLSASALADAVLEWDFTTGSAPSFEDESEREYITDDYVLISGGDCHVRDYPALSGDSLGVLRNGQTANCLGGKSTDERGVLWYEIDYNGMSGWVSSRYAFLNGVVSPLYVHISGGDCHMRDEPNLSGDSVGVMKEGSVGNYLNSTSTDERGVDWYFVSYKGKEAWVSSRYSYLSDDASSASASTSYGYVKATSHKVNLRDVPNLNGEDIGTMNKGETATYLGSKKTDSRGVVWYKVRFEGKTGWVSSRYTKLYK